MNKMNKLKNKLLEIIEKILNVKLTKKNIILGVIIFVSLLSLFRIIVFGIEKARSVFNISRNNIEYGIPVNVYAIKEEINYLKEPLFIKNNKTFISIKRIYKFKVGQKIGNGEIIFVSRNIKLDTGMCIIKTKNVEDGINYVEMERKGFFIPIYALYKNKVFLLKNGRAIETKVDIIDKDSSNALVKGLDDGDIVILSKVENNQKVKISEI